MPPRLLSLPFAASAFLLLGALPASAIEPDAVARALGEAVTEGSNVAATYRSADREGDDVVIHDFTFSRTSGEDTASFVTVVVASPKESDNGVFESPKIGFRQGTVTGKTNGSLAGVVMTDATILDPEIGRKNGFAGSILFDTVDIDDIRVTRDSEPGEVTIAHIAIEASNVVDNLAQDSRGRVEGVTLSPDFFPGASFTPSVIGYDKLVFDVTWDSSRDVAAKTMTIHNFTLQIHDGGELSVEGVVGNLPDPRVLNDAGATTKASKAEVHQLTVTYRDNSLAGRVLDVLAERQGLTRDQYTQQLSAALPFLLLALNNPTFQSQVVGALNGFLKDPRSLTVRLDPDSPVSGSEILSMLKSSPGSVPDRLKASVQANDSQ